ncbi:MAG: hypothetical protein WC565_08180, partial [Parcubacteria group bacterium]
QGALCVVGRKPGTPKPDIAQQAKELAIMLGVDWTYCADAEDLLARIIAAVTVRSPDGSGVVRAGNDGGAVRVGEESVKPDDLGLGAEIRAGGPRVVPPLQRLRAEGVDDE